MTPRPEQDIHRAVALTLPFQPSLNNLYLSIKGKGRVPTRKYRAWRTQALWEIRVQRVRPVTGAVSVHIRLVAPDRRRRDADNALKAVLDVLKAAGIIEDDSGAYVRRVSSEWAETGEPCTVTIETMEAT